MTPERWERIKDLFDAARPMPPEERHAFVARESTDDGAVRDEVMRLLAKHDQMGDFLERPSVVRTDDVTVAGRFIGPYKILEELGHGGMGVVYLAARVDRHYQQRVAIKVIKAGMSGDAVRHFRRERQILAGLDHPNISRLLDGGATEDGRPYLVMEYIHGQPLLEYCDHHELPIAERLGMFQQVCSAVAYAHRNLIVHRDLKPRNILVGADGVPRLLDFGVAKLLNPEFPVEALTATSLAMTPEYASPEQARGESVTTASDVYSLGVILYELLTGVRPYRLESRQPLDILRAVCEEEPERPSAALEKQRRRLRGDLDNIVLMALRKEPNRRYASVEAFSEDIQRHLDGLPVHARKGTPAYRVGKYVRPHAVGVTAAAAFVLLLIGFAATMAIQSAHLARERDRAAQERNRAETVSTFLVELFKVSDPSEAKGNTVTAREILDKGAAKIDGELTEQPETKAALMATMGRAHTSLGLYQKARPLLEEALRLRRQSLGREHPDVASSLDDLANVLDRKGEYAAAEALYRESLAMHRKLRGNEHFEVATGLDNLANVLYRRGDYAGAEPLHREALAMRRKLLGPEHPDVARSLNNLANVLSGKGAYAEAEALYREALALRRKLLGSEHLDVAMTINNLAIVLYEMGDYAGAEPLDREALATKRRLLGNEHPSVATSLANLARVLDHKGEYPAAEPLHREALAMRRKLLGNEHPDVATSLTNLARVLDHKGDYVGAEALSREALAMRRKLLGNGHPYTALSLNTLGEALSHEGRLSEAEDALRASLEMRRKALRPDHPDIADSLIGLGNILTAQGRAPDAEAMLRRGREIRQTSLPSGHPDIAEAESALADCLIGLRQFDEAESLLLNAYQVLRSKQPPSRATAEARQHLVDLYMAWDKPAQATRYR